MDYKEKLRLAKEALDSGSYDKETIEYIFPELKESRDEKTKRLLHTIANKMSQHLRDIFTEEEYQCFDAWSNAWLEKQGEQKHVFDVEIPFGTDSELVEEAITIPDGCYAIIEDNKVILRKGEKKSSWSEEDENYKDALIGLINEIKSQPLKRLEDWDSYIYWLKSLKDRVQFQSKQEWDEEDKMQLDAAIHLVSSTGHIETANWLKSLKYRYTWKPSDEQMGALEVAVDGTCIQETLYSLYQDLEKLK